MRYAIIDIGFNAIRAVVYDGMQCGSPEIYSCKFKNEILDLLKQDHFDTSHSVYSIFDYFKRIFSRLKVNGVKCVATAVLRGHQHAGQFQEIIRNKYDFNIEILSGEEEAYYTGLGVLASIPEADGVVVDLGGGSMELAKVSCSKVIGVKSLPLGTKIIPPYITVSALCEQIKLNFDTLDCNNLYLVGGALRTLGKYYIQFTDYPLKVLHGLEVSAEKFINYINKMYNNQTYKRIGDVNALTIIESLLTVFKPKKVVVSNYGLKEGVWFASISSVEQQKNILYEKCIHFTRFSDKECNFDAYRSLIVKLLRSYDEDILQIIDMSIMFASYYRSIDKTLKKAFLSELMLIIDMPFSHRQRLMMTVVLSCIFNAKLNRSTYKIISNLLNSIDYYNSYIIGYIMYIITMIDGPEFLMPTFDIVQENMAIRIVTKQLLPSYIMTKVALPLKSIAILHSKTLSSNFVSGESV